MLRLKCSSIFRVVHPHPTCLRGMSKASRKAKTRRDEKEGAWVDGLYHRHEEPVPSHQPRREGQHRWQAARDVVEKNWQESIDAMAATSRGDGGTAAVGLRNEDKNAVAMELAIKTAEYAREGMSTKPVLRDGPSETKMILGRPVQVMMVEGSVTPKACSVMIRLRHHRTRAI